MKSLKMIRTLFCVALLALTVNSAHSFIVNDTKAGIEAGCSAFMVGGVCTPMLNKAKEFTDRKAFLKSRKKTMHAVIAGGGGGFVSASGAPMRQARVGQQDLMRGNPSYAGSRSGQAGLQNNPSMTTPVQFVMPESTLGLKLTWTISTTTNTVATYIPFLPSKSDEQLPTNVTFSAGNFLDFDDFTDFYVGQPVILGDIMVTTATTSNFTLPIRVTTRKANGSSGTDGLTWDSISKNPANNDQTTRIVGQSGWTIGIAQVKYEIQMQQNSYLAFSADIAQSFDVRASRPFNG